MKKETITVDINNNSIALFCVFCKKEGKKIVAEYVSDGESVCEEHCKTLLMATPSVVCSCCGKEGGHNYCPKFSGSTLEDVAKEIIDENNGKLKLRFMDENSYNSGYLKDLPDTIEEAREDVGLEVNDDDYPIIDELRKEVDEFVLNVKLGLEPLAGVKPLLEKIDKELKI